MIKSIKIKNKEVKIPIVQGGMGVGVSLSSLASSVMNEGGIGTISAAQIGFREPGFNQSIKSCYEKNVEALKKEIHLAYQKSNGFLAINIMTASRQYEELARTAVKMKVDAIVSGAGMPFDLPKYVKNSSTAAIPIVANKRVLNVILKKWIKNYNYIPDAIIIEGPEAGGHLGVKKSELDKEVETLEKRLIDIKEYMQINDLNFPVIVAGGIYSSSDVKKILDLGADMVQLGTRFIATYECDASDNFKQVLINSTKESINPVSSPVGYPARAIDNEFTMQLKDGNIPVEKCLGCVIPCRGKVESTVYCITDHLIKSVNGDIHQGLFFTGSMGYKVNKIYSVKNLIDELLEEIR